MSLSPLKLAEIEQAISHHRPSDVCAGYLRPLLEEIKSIRAGQHWHGEEQRWCIGIDCDRSLALTIEQLAQHQKDYEEENLSDASPFP